MFGDRVGHSEREHGPEEEHRIRHFELRNGERVTCRYSVLKSKDSELGRCGQLVIEANGKTIDLRELAGVPVDFPIFFSKDENHISTGEGVDGGTVPTAGIVKMPDTFEQVAVILHEFGHIKQFDDSAYRSQHVGFVASKELARARDGLRLNSSEGILNALTIGTKRLHTISESMIRERFRPEFRVFLQQLDAVNVEGIRKDLQEIMKECIDLEERYSEKFEESGEFDEERYATEKRALADREKKLFLEIPKERILFFLTEPERTDERDATRRALIWIQYIGRALSLLSLADSSDEGAERLFLGLETYSFGCVQEPKEKGVG